MVLSVEEIEEALVGVGMPADRAHRVALAIDRAENAATVEDVEREVSHATELLRGEIERLAVQQDAKTSEPRQEVRRLAIEQDAKMSELRSEMKQDIAGLESQIGRLEELIRQLERRVEEERPEARARHRQLMIVVISISVTLGTAIVGGMIAILLRLFGAV